MHDQPTIKHTLHPKIRMGQKWSFITVFIKYLFLAVFIFASIVQWAAAKSGTFSGERVRVRFMLPQLVTISGIVVSYLRVLFVKAYCSVEGRAKREVPVSDTLVLPVHEESDRTRGRTYFHCSKSTRKLNRVYHIRHVRHNF